MNAVTPEPTASPPVAAAAPTPPPPPNPRAGHGLVLFALAVAAIALVMCGLLWQRLGVAQEEMARRARDAQAQVVEARTLAGQAEALTQELQARLGVAEVRLSEVSLQRSQLEELMLSLSRSRDDNLVQDLEASLRVAVQQAQLTGNAQPLIAALQAAEQRIGRAAQPRLNPVQRAIARDVDRIRGAALADIPALAGQLDDIVRQVDAWPVANAVGVTTVSTPARVREPATPVVAPAAADAAPEDPTALQPGAWERWMERWKAWWVSAFEHSVQEARDLVRVSRIDQPDAALLAPEQAFFLRENIKLQLLNARLALLARQLPASQADVLAVENKLKRYFDTRSPAVNTAVERLGRLRRDLVSQDLPRPDETLAALAAAAGGR